MGGGIPALHPGVVLGECQRSPPEHPHAKRAAQTFKSPQHLRIWLVPAVWHLISGVCGLRFRGLCKTGKCVAESSAKLRLLKTVGQSPHPTPGGALLCCLCSAEAQSAASRPGTAHFSLGWSAPRRAANAPEQTRGGALTFIPHLFHSLLFIKQGRLPWQPLTAPDIQE